MSDAGRVAQVLGDRIRVFVSETTSLVCFWDWIGQSPTQAVPGVDLDTVVVEVDRLIKVALFERAQVQRDGGHVHVVVQEEPPDPDDEDTTW
jgi:hypothetical protein